MRVALLSDDWRPTGGVVSHVRLVAAALAAAGHTVLVVHAGDPDDAAETLPAGLTVRAMPSLLRDRGPHANRAAVAPVLGALAEFQPDLAHIHACTNLGVEDAVRATLPTVKTIHTLDLCPSGTKFHYATGTCCTYATGLLCLPRQAYLRCTLSKRPQVWWRGYQYAGAVAERLRGRGHVVVASEFVRRFVVDHDVPEDRVTVVPYFTPEVPDVPASTGRTVLFVGRVTPEKGVLFLVDALRRVPDPWRLVVAGEGIGMAEAKHAVASRGVADRVEFRGWLQGAALRAAYVDAAVVAVPSRWPEPFGIVGIEAMAHGRPVVACAVGGVPEWLSDGEGGYLVPPGDVRAMASRLEACLQDPAHASVVAARGRARVRREFTADAHLARLIPLYTQVVARGC